MSSSCCNNNVCNNGHRGCGGGGGVVYSREIVWITIVVLLSVQQLSSTSVVSGFSSAVTQTTNSITNKQPLSSLLEIHKDNIAKLKTIYETTSVASDSSDGCCSYMNDVFYLRYCLSYPNNDDEIEREKMFKSMLQWRMSGSGKSICDAASNAVKLATSKSTSKSTWDNEPVIQNAPNSIAITQQYITPKSAITTTTSQNDLIYCIRAGNIDDTGLMSSVTILDMVNFFLYIKEVNSIVANIRSVQYGQLIQIITCNDLSGIKLIGNSNSGSTDFRKALSQSSTIANEYYPSSYNGPTLLLNLPTLVSFLVQLFTPLFPQAVRDRLKFQQGPLRDIEQLTILTNKESNEYKQFISQIDDIVYNAKIK